MKKNGLLQKRPMVDKNSWEKEHRAFLRLRPSLLRTLRNQYVAVYGQKVVDSDDDKIALALRVYQRFGYVPVYVGPVSAKPAKVVRIPSPRRTGRRRTK